jgi:hypothetical protein
MYAIPAIAAGALRASASLMLSFGFVNLTLAACYAFPSTYALCTQS